MNECMIDLETLSSRPDAIILTIGAIKFSRYGKIKSLEECDTFYRRIKIDSCKRIGLRKDAETVNWWNDQDSEIKDEAFGKERVTLRQALKEFSDWFGNCQYIWSHGSSFDCTILKEAYIHCNLEAPWSYHNERDTRTIYDICRVNLNCFGVQNKHHALWDCYFQIKGVELAIQNMII